MLFLKFKKKKNFKLKRKLRYLKAITTRHVLRLKGKKYFISNYNHNFKIWINQENPYPHQSMYLNSFITLATYSCAKFKTSTLNYLYLKKN
jgi:hypothetical protein